jgi:DNA-binding transcriptional regulator PaaX
MEINEALKKALLAKSNFDVIGYINKYSGISVTGIMLHCEVSHSDVSQRLSRIKKVGWVVGFKDGITVHYALTEKAVKDLIILKKFRKFSNKIKH